MRIRLALTLSVTRDSPPPDDTEPARETQLDAWVADVDQRHDAPRIGFTSIEEEPR